MSTLCQQNARPTRTTRMHEDFLARLVEEGPIQRSKGVGWAPDLASSSRTGLGFGRHDLPRSEGLGLARVCGGGAQQVSHRKAVTAAAACDRCPRARGRKMESSNPTPSAKKCRNPNNVNRLIDKIYYVSVFAPALRNEGK